MKRGKTWWLMYTAIQAMMSNYKVIFISLEMNMNQILRRFWRYLSGQPAKPKTVKKPKFVMNDDDLYDVVFVEEEKAGVDVGNISRLQEKIKSFVRPGDIRVIQFPSYSATIKDIIMEIDNLAYFENYNAGVIVIDYADIIKPDKSFDRSEYRHKINSIWKGLRGLAQEKCVHIVTASQTSRAGFNQDATENIIAEDVMKVAEISKLFGISQDKFDRQFNAVRIEQLAEREEQRNLKQAFVIQNLDVGNPHVASVYVDQMNKKEEKKGYGREKKDKD
jgi:predicted XRE-type DNA-binding protein